LISLLKTVSELDRLEELRETTATCYALAIRSTAQYAIEVEPAQAEGFRRHLEALQGQLQSAATTFDLRAVQSSFRGELRGYRDEVSGQLARMRKEMEAATAALQTLANSVIASGADHEAEVKQHLVELDAASRCNDIESILAGIRRCSTAIAVSIEEMRRSHQFLIVQLHDEIRVLHQEIENERRSFFTDPVSGAWNRQKIDARIQDLLQLNDSFSVLLVRFRNSKWLASQHSAAVIRQTLQAMLLRFQGLAGEEVMIGRWNDDEFIAILETQPVDALAISRDVARKLSTTYTIQEGGVSQNVNVQATSGVMERRVGTDHAAFHEKLTELSDTLSGP